MGLGLSEEDTKWWLRTFVIRVDNTNTGAILFYYADLIEKCIHESRSFLTHEVLLKFSKMAINIIYPIFKDEYLFYEFIYNYGYKIIKFISIYNKLSNKYITELIIKYVDMNYYVECGTFENLIDLFPNTIVDDSNQLEKWCDEVISVHQKAVEDYKNGKESALNSIKGQVMKLSKGKANINLIGDILIKKINNIK